MLWEPYPSYYNGLFSPLLVQRFRCQKGRSLLVLYEQYKTSYLFYVTLSFLCNIICYLISVFVFSLISDPFRGHNTKKPKKKKKKNQKKKKQPQNNTLTFKFNRGKIYSCNNTYKIFKHLFKKKSYSDISNFSASIFNFGIPIFIIKK